MSGGHYHYAFAKIAEMADAIIDDCGASDQSMPPDIRCHMETIAFMLRDLAKAAHDIEWWMSSDYSDDTLRQCVSWALSERARSEQ